MSLQSPAHLLSTSNFVRARASFAALAFFILTAAAQQIGAATITVINTADSGAGSLRQAVVDANATTAADTINFNIPLTDINCNASGVCTITLTGGAITIQAAESLTIANQTGANKLLISGNNQNRIFVGGLGTNLTIDGLTITRGVGDASTGGTGVVSNNRGTLTVMNSVFTRNSGNVISTSGLGAEGNVNIVGTTINDNAGRGIIFVNNSGGTLNITASTISNNISSSGSGGGIYFIGNQLRITNSTISGNSNSQSGGIYATTAPTSSLILTNCTVTGNSGGGIYDFQATLNLRNTIVSGNTGTDITFYNSHGASLGNNLIGTTSNLEFGNAQWLPSDMLNQTAQLAPLGNYGGATQTHALLPNSPAINAGNNCVLTANGCGDGNPAVPTDQRGAVRVRTVDIGAFEFASRPEFDFDGDGKSDISVFRPSNGTWYRLNSSNNSFYAAQFGQSGDLLAPADFDGDGKIDIAVYRQGTSNYFYILNSADNTFRFAQFGISGDEPVAGDWDGDGRADIAIYRRFGTANEAFSYFYYRPTSTNEDFRTITMGFSGRAVVGDFDGDGKIDATLFRSTGVWSIVRSSDNQTTHTTFGAQTDIPVAADYDADGKTNIAVFRPSNGTWYTSLDPANNYGAILFGQAGDVPVPADYDGDGKADTAVFRPSNGAWYLNRTTSGFSGVLFGASDDKPVPNAFIR